MFSQQERQNAYTLAILDGIFLGFAFVFAFLTRVLWDLPGLPASPMLDAAVHVWLPATGVPIYWFVGGRTGAFVFHPRRGLIHALWKLTKSFAYLALFVATAVFLFQAKSTSRAVFFLFLGYGFASLAVIRLALWAMARNRPDRFAEKRDVLIVGTGPDAEDLRRKLETRPEWGIRVVGYIQGPGESSSDALVGPVLGEIGEFEHIAQREHVDEVVFALPFVETLACKDQILWCEEVGRTVHLRTDFVRTIFAKVYPTEIDGTPMLTLSPISRDAGALLVKRALDLVVSGIMLVVTAPLMAGIAIAIKVTSRGPVYFSQRRVGLNGRIFTMHKFRSMYRDAERRRAELQTLNEVDGPVFKIKRDPRITPVGRWLRKFSLDELPQFWHVFAGDMSLVGPRPPLPHEVEQYERWQRRRLSMKPGLTCLWQVSGRNHIGFEEWMRLDLAYIDNWSLGLDIRILLRTVPAVVLARGAQ